MTFRELAFRDELGLPSSLMERESEKPLLQSLLDNQSPIMKFWFVIMVLNLAMFLFIIH